MTTTALSRVAVVGATGSLGRQLVEILGDRRYPVGHLLAIAGEDSLGQDVELAGEVWPISGAEASLAEIDLVFLCAPPDVSLEWAGRALRTPTPCIDVSGTLAGQPDVPLLVADRMAPDAEIHQPLVAGPPATSLAAALVLGPLAEAAGLRSVVGTVLASASSGGRDRVDALSSQSLAVFGAATGGAEDPVPGIAFDCDPVVGHLEDDGATDAEHRLVAALQRLVRSDLPVALTAVRVPTFVGDGVSLRIETERPLSPDDARAVLAKAPGVEVATSVAPTTRATAGRDQVVVARVRRDPTCERGLQLWLAADGVRLAALNGVKLAESRPLPRPPR